MDATEIEQLKVFLLHGQFPEGADKHQRFAVKRKASNFSVIEDQLYYKRRKGTLLETSSKVVSTAEEADTIFQEFHCGDISGHPGQLKTRDAISQRFYWPGMSTDIEKWVSQCTECQSKRKSIKLQPEFTQIMTKAPFELIGMDLIGKLTKTDNQNQYICVLIDYRTRWAQAYPMKLKNAVEVTNCLLKFVYQFEVPKRILTDNGREFVNNINTEVCNRLGIKRSLCAPYHPQTNGLVEKFNDTIQKALGKLVKDKTNTWDQYLEPVMFGLRTKKQLTTQFSPFHLMFGREARYPSQVPEYFQMKDTMENDFLAEEVAIDIQRHEEIMKIVEDNTKRQHDRIRGRTRQKGLLLPVGALVWRENVRSQQRKGGKPDREYLGPFTVVKVEGKSVDLIDINGRTFPKVSIDHLKMYVEEVPRVPQRMKRAPPPVGSATPIKTLTPLVEDEDDASPTPSPVSASTRVTSPTPPPVSASTRVTSPTTSPVSTSTPVSSPTPSPVGNSTRGTMPTPSPVGTSTHVTSPTPSPVGTSAPVTLPTPSPVGTSTPVTSPTPSLVGTSTPVPSPAPMDENEEDDASPQCNKTSHPGFHEQCRWTK
ncbi:hypothetical protein R3I94_006184 [Phoxinus phoxinus]